ncbi:MAG: hypothetical protein M0Z50_08315 [Planctomycetia bacterium]|nr:hypothetical protein [Planctomycetia bacterium]
MNRSDFNRYKATITSVMAKHVIHQHQSIIKHLKELEAAAKRLEPGAAMRQHFKQFEAAAKRLESSIPAMAHLKQLIAGKIKSNQAMAEHLKQLRAMAIRLGLSESTIKQIETIINEFFP